MEKIQKSQLAKMVLFLVLLIFIPFISSSVRPSYLYLILNVLIIVLGVEAGLLAKIPAPRTEGTPILPVPIVPSSPPIHMEAKQKDEIGVVSMNTPTSPERAGKPDKPPVVEKKLKAAVSKVIKQVRRCPSRPSLFFIGGYDADEKVEDHEVEALKVVEDEEVFDHGGQELFHKAEMFIGNFYNQLKMQREDSWNKIHGL